MTDGNERLPLLAIPYPWGFVGTHIAGDRTFAYAAWSDVRLRRRLATRLEADNVAAGAVTLTGDRAMLEALHVGWQRFAANPGPAVEQVVRWETERWAPRLMAGSSSTIRSGHVVVMMDRRIGIGPDRSVSSVLFVTSTGLLWSAVDGTAVAQAVVKDAVGGWRTTQHAASVQFGLITREGEVGFMCSRQADIDALRAELTTWMPAA